MKFLLIKIICIFYSLIQLSEQEVKPKRKKTSRKTLIYTTEEELMKDIAEELHWSSKMAIEDVEIFKIGITGGSLIKHLATAIPKIRTDWSKWKIYLCEEQLVSLDHPNSTYGAYKKIFDSIPDFPHSQLVPVNITVSPKDASENYYMLMIDDFFPLNFPEFDVLMFGVREDGFMYTTLPSPIPGEFQDWIAYEKNSTKPTEQQRISITHPVANKAKVIIYAVSGKSNADAVKTAVEELPNTETPPPGLVDPPKGTILWMLDKDAASKLSE